MSSYLRLQGPINYNDFLNGYQVLKNTCLTHSLPTKSSCSDFILCQKRCAENPTLRRNPSPSCALRGPGRTCAPSSGPSCWRSLKGRWPCPPPEGSESWGVADGAAACWLRRQRPHLRSPAAATNPGNVEGPLHRMLQQQENQWPLPPSLEPTPLAVRSLPRP